MRIEYNKLVRDRIPEIIRAEGRICKVEVLPLQEYREALLTKLMEEAAEITDAPPEKLALEVADLLEVLDALMQTFELEPHAVRALQEQRRQERGGFERRYMLLWTE